MSLLEQGTTLEGKYEILDRLAGGGMSEVYLVRHIHLHEPRVIKLLRAELARDAQAAERFHREARTAIQIKHPNVAILYDYSRLPDGTFYMVWEYIKGEDVAHRIKRRGPCPLPVALDLAKQTLSGLEAIHAAHVIHRDLSPDNLMLSRDPRGRLAVKIIDLGLAKSLSDRNAFQSQAGSFQGKLLYCSPEQAGLVEDDSLDHRTDLYSFAIVLYELITGKLPFDVQNQPGMLFKRFSQEPLSLMGRNPEVEVPVELDQILDRALEHDREKRFPDAVAFRRALAEVGQRGLPAPSSAVRPLPRPETPAPTPPAPPSSQAGSSGARVQKLTDEERSEILSQIASSSKRIEDSSRLVGRADRAIQEGHLDGAAQLIDTIAASYPRLFGLTELKKRLKEAQGKRRQAQIVQTEQMLREYIQEGQQTLAGVALSTLLDLAPDYSERETFEKQLVRLAKAAEQRQEEEAVSRAVRESLAREDLGNARMQLAKLEAENEANQKLIDQLRQEVETLDVEQRETLEIDANKKRLEGFLAAHQLEEAQDELELLTRFNLPKVTLDLYRQRLVELRSQAETETTIDGLEERYRKCLDKEDWQEARKITLELDASVDDSPRTAKMLGEISGREEQANRVRAVEEGTTALEGYLQQGQLLEAELAWKVLSQIAPHHPGKKKYERRLRSLRRGRGD